LWRMEEALEEEALLFPLETFMERRAWVVGVG